MILRHNPSFKAWRWQQQLASFKRCWPKKQPLFVHIFHKEPLIAVGLLAFFGPGPVRWWLKITQSQPGWYNGFESCQEVSRVWWLRSLHEWAARRNDGWGFVGSKVGEPFGWGKQNNKQLTMKHKVVEYDFLGNLFKMKSGSMRWTGVNEVNMDVQSWISWIDCIMLHQKQSYFGRLRAKWDAFTERQKRAYQEFFRGIGQV